MNRLIGNVLTVNLLVYLTSLSAGHSRLVVGFEECYTKIITQRLVLFDPSHSPAKMQQLFEGEKQQNTGFNMLRKSPKQLKSKQYQLVYVDGLLTEDERQVLDIIMKPSSYYVADLYFVHVLGNL